MCHSCFSLHDEKLSKTKFAENEMTAERADEMVDEMGNENKDLQNEMANDFLFAERNGERCFLLMERRNITRHELFYVENEIANEIISIRKRNRTNFVPDKTFFVPGNPIFCAWQ